MMSMASTFHVSSPLTFADEPLVYPADTTAALACVVPPMCCSSARRLFVPSLALSRFPTGVVDRTSRCGATLPYLLLTLPRSILSEVASFDFCERMMALSGLLVGATQAFRPATVRTVDPNLP